jgi:hypothetical protein
MARARQDWLQVAPNLLALGSALLLAGLLGAPEAPAAAATALGQSLAQGQPGAAQVQGLYGDDLPRQGSRCPLLVPSEMPFLQPKRLKPGEVKAKNASGCLSPADAIYGADGCPLKLCPNPQWQGL